MNVKGTNANGANVFVDVSRKVGLMYSGNLHRTNTESAMPIRHTADKPSVLSTDIHSSDLPSSGRLMSLSVGATKSV